MKDNNGNYFTGLGLSKLIEGIYEALRSGTWHMVSYCSCKSLINKIISEVYPMQPLLNLIIIFTVWLLAGMRSYALLLISPNVPAKVIKLLKLGKDRMLKNLCYLLKTSEYECCRVIIIAKAIWPQDITSLSPDIYNQE